VNATRTGEFRRMKRQPGGQPHALARHHRLAADGRLHPLEPDVDRLALLVPRIDQLVQQVGVFWPSSRNSMPAPGTFSGVEGEAGRTQATRPRSVRRSPASTSRHCTSVPAAGQLGPGDVDPSRAQVLDAGDDALVSSRRAQANLRLEDDATLAPKLHRLCWTPENTDSLATLTDRTKRKAPSDPEFCRAVTGKINRAIVPGTDQLLCIIAAPISRVPPSGAAAVAAQAP
jgi:hypothetical protein